MIITNQSNVAFNYVLPDGQTIAADLDSNVVTTVINRSDPVTTITRVFFCQSCDCQCGCGNCGCNDCSGGCGCCQNG